MHAPIEAMDMAADLLTQVGDKPWPKPLLQWQQIHTPKPGKGNTIPNARPLALGSAWYRLWSSFYAKQLKDWTSKQLPSQQHGAISKRGVATALIPFLCGIEQGLHEPDNPALPHFIGTADLSKAFDRVYAPAADQALQRMQLPDCIRQPLAMQWNQQQRWLTYKSNPSATALAGDQPLKSTIMDYQRGSFKSLRPCEWGITLAKRWVIMGYHLTGVDPPDVKF